MRLLAAAFAVILTAGLPGCFSLFVECDEPGPWPVATPLVEGTHLGTDPDQTWDTLLFDPGYGGPGNASLTPAVTPASWSVGVHAITPNGTRDSAGAAPALSILRVEPGAGSGQLTVRKSVDVEIDGECHSGRGGTIAWDLMEPQSGSSARAGQGVHVMTAGFWENGTLFYTNIAEINADPDWPRAGWYTWEGADPLPVYVYDADRGEQPATWTDPQAGTPVAGSVSDVGYFTTIPGFNEALKGLSTTTTRVVRLAPEEAYTRPGNEEHDLYGDAIVFYIKVLDVVDFPCPQWVDAGFCRVPDAPLAASPMADGSATTRPRV